MTKDPFNNTITFGTRLFINPVRKDGKYPVIYTFLSTGKTIKKLLTKEKLEEERKKDIEIIEK